MQWFVIPRNPQERNMTAKANYDIFGPDIAEWRWSPPTI